MNSGVNTENNNNHKTIIVIDDEEIIRFNLRKKLTKYGYNVITLDKAEDALYLLKNGEHQVDFIITDIRLRKMDGIEFLRHVDILDNPVPVLLMGQGNIEDAVKALRYGACDFIRKPFETNEVVSVVRHVLKQKDEEIKALDLGEYITLDHRTFLLPADMELGATVAFQLTKNLSSIGVCNQVTAENISLALREALSNAMFHGNLEVSSDIREKEGTKAYNELIDARKSDPILGSRRVKLEYKLTSDFVEYIIEDDGKGFDFKKLPDPRDPENFFKKSGRGILIIKIHMDEVKWNDKGNKLIMRKNKVK